MKIIHANESGGLCASSPLYLRLRTFKITLTILSESLAPRLRRDSDFAPPPPLLPSEGNLVDFGFLILVPVLLCLWGEPVRAVHIEFSTPGLCSHPRFVSSLSEGVQPPLTVSVCAVALAVIVSPTVDLAARGEEGAATVGELRQIF